jgi:hypothetical protein
MNDLLKNNLAELDKDLSDTWINLSEKVRKLAYDLKIKAKGSEFAAEADDLSKETARICDHVTKFHTDIINLIENIETQLPLPDPDVAVSPILNDSEALNQEIIRIQREKHEMRKDIKDILKALFLWVDDPKERLREKF